MYNNRSYNLLVVGAPGLEHGLVSPSTAGDDTDHGSALRTNRLLGPRRQADLAGALVLVVRDDHRVVAGATRERATVTDLTEKRRTKKASLFCGEKGLGRGWGCPVHR